MTSRLRGIRWPDATALVLAVTFAATFSFLAIQRHHGLRTQMNDLGNMVQAIWGAAQGDLTMQVSNEGGIRSRITIHANFIFLLIAAPFAFFPSLERVMPEILLVLSSTAGALAGLGIYCSARTGMAGKSLIAPLLIAVAFWLNPMVHDAVLFDFHIITVTTALLVWMHLAWSRGHEFVGWVLLLLAMSCKEDVPFILMALGIGEVCWGNARRGRNIVLVNLGYVLVLFGFVIPLLGDGHALPVVASARLAWLGNSPSEWFASVAQSPGRFLVDTVFSTDRIRLLLYLFLLGGGIGVLSEGKRYMVGVLPIIGVAFISSGTWMTRITGTYYWITAIALIYLACIQAAKDSKRNHHYGIAVYVFLMSLAATILFSQTPLGLHAKFSDFRVNAMDYTAVRQIQSIIPHEAAISAQNNIAAHLAKRRIVGTYPNCRRLADFVVLHARYPGGPDPLLFPSSSPAFLLRWNAHQHLRIARQLNDDKDWQLIYCQKGFFVFSRSGRKTNQLEVNWSDEQARLVDRLQGTDASNRKWIHQLVGA